VAAVAAHERPASHEARASPPEKNCEDSTSRASEEIARSLRRERVGVQGGMWACGCAGAEGPGGML